MVGSGYIGIGGDAEGGLGGRTDGGLGGDRMDGDGDVDGLNRSEDNVENVILGKEPNSPLDYAPGLELHHQIMSTFGWNGVRLERERER